MDMFFGFEVTIFLTGRRYAAQEKGGEVCGYKQIAATRLELFFKRRRRVLFVVGRHVKKEIERRRRSLFVVGRHVQKKMSTVGAVCL